MTPTPPRDDPDPHSKIRGDATVSDRWFGVVELRLTLSTSSEGLGTDEECGLSALMIFGAPFDISVAGKVAHGQWLLAKYRNLLYCTGDV